MEDDIRRCLFLQTPIMITRNYLYLGYAGRGHEKLINISSLLFTVMRDLMLDITQQNQSL